MSSLYQAPAGSVQTVKWFYGDRRLRDEAERLGVSPGQKLTVVGSFFGNTIVRLGDLRRIALSSEVAERIMI